MVAADYDFYLTREKIIRRALSMVGAYHEGEILSAYKKNQGIETLNTMVKAWQTKGTFLWTEKPVLVALSNGVDDYAMPSDANGSPLFCIDKAFIRDGTDDKPLSVVSWRDYQGISNKADTGFPSRISHDQANGRFYVHLVPNEAMNLYVFGLAKLKDFESDSAGGDFPARWDRALVFGLAYDLSFEFLTSQGKKEELKREAEGAFLQAKSTEIWSSSDEKRIASCYPTRRK